MRPWNFEHPRALRDLDVEKLIAFGFTDESWRNDVCPKFVNKDRSLLVWADYRYTTDRERPGYMRFIVCRYIDDEATKELYATHNYDTLLDALSIYICTGEWSLDVNTADTK